MKTTNKQIFYIESSSNIDEAYKKAMKLLRSLIKEQADLDSLIKIKKAEINLLSLLDK